MTEIKERKPVHFHVYNPAERSLFKAGANEKAKAFVVNCSNSENCELFKRGECVTRGMFGGRCPYGSQTSYTGYTKRARKFRSWILEQKEIYKDVGSLGAPRKMMGIVGDYVYLPYAHMNMCESVPFLSHGGFMTNGSGLIKREDFTVDNIIVLIKFRPMALMGGEIRNYQKEEIPKFLTHLSQMFPDIFEAVMYECPEAQKRVEEITNVGRKANLFTLNPNVGTFVDIHKGEWTWDGEWLTSFNSHASFMLVKGFDEIKVKPSGNFLEVKITDELQVNENTEFIE